MSSTIKVIRTINPLIILGIVSFIGCSNKPKKINNSSSEPLANVLIPFANYSNQSAGDYLARNPEVAISGRLYLKDQFSTTLANVNLEFFQFENGQWKKISDLSTNFEGQFAVTQTVRAGKYELRVANPKYEGKLSVTLDDKPEKDLIFEVTRKAQK